MKNRQNRCVMKIDVRNAYDTVNWDFLSENLKKFGFHSKMVYWIMTCVSSCGYSICINGDRYMYFKGGKGLRQCDSISLYLFNLVIHKNVLESHSFKYHQGCKDMMLTHLCFVDDLLVLCHGDSGSVEVVKKSLDNFSLVSGLQPNMNKSTIFFRILNEGERARILNIMPFAMGKLPMKYLGDSAYLLPKITMKDINTVLKRFLWNDGDRCKGKAKIAWKLVCRPKDQGGLGNKHLHEWNKVLPTKHIWNISVKKDTLWVK
ncbi:RNA-directed DNA polymerase, eukaryota, reverse transcriptase zinc-binding domain protein [Tanacetum coccineum]